MTDDQSAAALLHQHGEGWIDTIRAVYREEKQRDATSREIADHTAWILEGRDGGWNDQKIRAYARAETHGTPTGPVRTVAVIVRDKNHRGIEGVNVTLDEVGRKHSGITNADGYVALDGVTNPLPASQVWLTKVGYEDFNQHVALPDGNFNLTIDGFTASHKDPSAWTRSELAAIRGSMWTARLDVDYGPRPKQPDNILNLNAFHLYPKHEQERMFDAYKSRGYTHMDIGPWRPGQPGQGYHGQYPDIELTFAQFLDNLETVWDHELVPIVFIKPDDWRQPQLETLSADYSQPRAQRLIRVCVPGGWEPGPKYAYSNAEFVGFFQWAARVLPDALRLLHMVADLDAPVGSTPEDQALHGDWGKAWGRLTPLMHGWLVQNAAFEAADAIASNGKTNFQNFREQFDLNVPGSLKQRFHRGYAGWPNTSAWGTRPILVYAGEYAAYWSYWHNRPEAESQQWGDAAMAAGADGYFDGGIVKVPVPSIGS